MSQEQWIRIDRYLSETLLEPDPALEAALETSHQAGLPPINVSALQGKFLALLAQIQGAQKILEIGTLGGYSTIWLARALPVNGRLVTLEVSPDHAEVARNNVARAGLSAVVQLRVGRALETLPTLAEEGGGPFDFVFIDADKEHIPEYFEWALRLTRVGSVIVVDNVIRAGRVLDANSEDPNIRGVRRFNQRLSEIQGVSATALQTVGSKGHDGFALIRVTASS